MIWLGLALLFTGLLLGTTFAHVLEIRAKRGMDGALWTALQQRLYRSFATIGGAVEIGGIVVTAVLAWNTRRVVLSWIPAVVPRNWPSLRRRWDRGHAIRFVLHMIGFLLLIGLAVLS